MEGLARFRCLYSLWPVPGELSAYNTGKQLNLNHSYSAYEGTLRRKGSYLLALKDQPEEADVVAMTEEAAEEVSPMEKSLLYDVVTTELFGTAPIAGHAWNIVPCSSSTFPRLLTCAVI